MRDETIQVETERLHRGAAELAGTAYRLGQGLHRTSGLTVAAPQWRAAEALATLESTVHAWLTAVGGRAAQTATGVRAAADAYEAVDDRAARRLIRTR